MASFPNTLGALVADHLINDTRSECCAPVMKAVLRDVKKYIALRYQKAGQRRLPLGFGGHSYKDDRKVLNYMATGGDDRSIDFWTVCIRRIAKVFCSGTATDYSSDSVMASK